MSKKIYTNDIMDLIKNNPNFNRVPTQAEQDRYVNNYLDLIQSSSMNRIATHLNNRSPFFIVSAFRTEQAGGVNKFNTQELKDFTQAYGLGFIPLLGTYTDDDGITGEELAIFVPFYKGFTGYADTQLEDITDFHADFRKFGLALGDMYNQESILYKNMGVEDKFLIYFAYMDKRPKTILAKDKAKLDLDNVLEYASQLQKGTKNSRKKWNIVQASSSYKTPWRQIKDSKEIVDESTMRLDYENIHTGQMMTAEFEVLNEVYAQEDLDYLADCYYSRYDS